MTMFVFGRPQPDQPVPPTWQFALFAVIGVLLLGFIIQQWRLGGANGVPLLAPTADLQQARLDLRDGHSRQAARLLTVLARKGDPKAQYWLGSLDESGIGTKPDVAKAITLYKQAADHDLGAAELRLGEIYLHGNLTLPDSSLARAYLKRAAYQGEPGAAMLIGQMYGTGAGTASDPVKAYAWSEVATVEGDKPARKERDAALHALDLKGQQAGVARAKDILAAIKQKMASGPAAAATSIPPRPTWPPST
jgi:TPR repeat protein